MKILLVIIKLLLLEAQFLIYFIVISYTGTKYVEDLFEIDKMESANDARHKKTEHISSKCEEHKKQNPFATLKAKICSAQLPKSNYLTKIAVNKSIGLLSDAKSKSSSNSVDIAERRNSDHSLHYKKEIITSKQSSKNLINIKSSERDPNFSKSTGFLFDNRNHKNNCGKAMTSKLRIKICKTSDGTYSKSHTLETDSSNEYESETGIPKSPTLFISGVSISRTPEPKSPGNALISGGRQSRSSSLSVPVPLSTCSLNISSSSLNNSVSPDSSIGKSTPATSRSNIQSSPKSSPSRSNTSNKENTKSKSASEPEREREMFRFPKSSTDGALSSVLHVQESNLSSDDFHEALFLLERSPKQRDSKRRKKSKKKDKEERKEETSSAL